MASHCVINRFTKESRISVGFAFFSCFGNVIEVCIQPPPQQNLYLFILRFGAPFVPPLYGLITSIVLGISRSNRRHCGCHICLCRAWHCFCSIYPDISSSLVLRRMISGNTTIPQIITCRRSIYGIYPLGSSIFPPPPANFRKSNGEKNPPWPWQASCEVPGRR